MKLITLPVGMLSENTYIYFDEETKRGVIIDPGDECETVLRAVDELGLEVAMILLTHGHFDHTGAVNALKNALGVPVAIHMDDKSILEETGGRINRRSEPVLADTFVEDGQVLAFGAFELRVIHTPGHSPGSCCFYHKENNTLFSGDTLFFRSIGRYDFPGGDFKAIRSSIKEKLFALPGDTDVYPGHGPKTSIGGEQLDNPFVGENAR